MSNTCDMPKCQQPAWLTYYNHPICHNHWKQFCDGKVDMKEKLKIKCRDGEHSDKTAP